VLAFGDGELFRCLDGLEWGIVLDGVENYVHCGERPSVEVFGGVMLVKGTPLAIVGRAWVNGPNFATGAANVLVVVDTRFFNVL